MNTKLIYSPNSFQRHDVGFAVASSGKPAGLTPTDDELTIAGAASVLRIGAKALFNKALRGVPSKFARLTSNSINKSIDPARRFPACVLPTGTPKDSAFAPMP